jgi:NAD-dependent dihydropyrimidine dehydrogenase PreA subunit
MKSVRKIIQIDEALCDGCGQCVPDCAEGSLQIIDGKARLVADKFCDGLGACLGSCPSGALQIIDREAEDFDEQAVEAFLAKQKQADPAPTLACGCPSEQMQSLRPFTALSPCQAANMPAMQTSHGRSNLSHWPVQIRLIPANAPFLDNCDVLVAADCTALAYAGIQQDFVAGRVVMMGCPKFDDAQLYVERFTEIFRTRTIRSLTILIMEVPCCHAMLAILQQALDGAKAAFSVRQAVVSVRGTIVEEKEI